MGQTPINLLFPRLAPLESPLPGGAFLCRQTACAAPTVEALNLRGGETKRGFNANCGETVETLKLRGGETMNRRAGSFLSTVEPLNLRGGETK